MSSISVQTRQAAVVISILLVSAGASAFGQLSTGTITGVVSDSSGGVAPNVKVSLVQVETNFETRLVSNNEGLYRAQALQPGDYRITFELQGFKRTVRTGVSLRVGDVLPVNATMEVGQVGDSIQVSGQATILETETSSTGTLTEGSTLYKMPLYQRYVLNTLNLTPGMTMNGYSYGGSMGGFNVGGQRSTGTAVYEDGVFGNDPQSSSGTDIKPVENSVGEVKVVTGTLPAEYGHTTGGVVTVVKKGGTNELHGLAADFGRTRKMTHRQFFNIFKTSDPQPGSPNGVPAWFMMPDANIGGPIFIPKVYDGRNKTFFFFGYQKLIEKKSAAFTSQTPTPAELGGDFTFGGVGQQIYDPLTTRQNADGTWTRDPIAGNIVPASRFDKVSSKVLSMNPWVPPNTVGSLTSTGPVSNYTWASKSRTFLEDYSTRIDQQFSHDLKVNGSWTYNHQSGLGRPTSVALPIFDGANGTLTPFTQKNASIGATKLFSATSFNEVKVGYYRARNDTMVPSFNANWASQLGIPNDNGLLMPSFSSVMSSGNGAAPALNTMYGLTVPGPSRTVRETLSFRDDYTRIVGTHAFKMGYEMLHFRANFFQLGQPSGVFQFDNTTAGLQPNGQPVPNTGNLLAGFEIGSVAQTNFSSYTSTWLPRDTVHSLYFQDDWKFSKTLTFNLGLRWSTESPFHTAHGQQSNFDPAAIDPVSGKPGAIVHPTGSLSSRSLTNFQPRIGLAWHPRERMVFRGGFGINTIDIRFPNGLQQFDEYQAQAVQARAPGDPRPLYQLSQGPTPFAYATRADGTVPYLGTNYGSRNINWMDGNLHPGYAANWNLSAEYQLGQNNLVRLTYQGSAGIHLIESWNVNVFNTDFGATNPTLRNAAFAATQNYLPFTQYGSINYMSNTGHSSYHAGTVQYLKRYSQGLVLNSFYTFSKTLDDCDNDYGTCTGVAPVSDRNLNKGRAGFDRNHVFVTSATYELPMGKGRHFVNNNKVLDWIVGGYELAWVQSFMSGNPFGFSFANSPNNYYPGSIGNRVPNLTCSGISMQQFGLGRLIGGNRFNQSLENPVLPVSCFSAPDAFTPGNAGRNIVTGPGVMYSQVSVKKNFNLSERFKLELRFDFQNPFHNYGFNAPSNSVDFKSPQLFGKITGDQTTASFTGQPLMNLGLRLSW